MTEKELKAYLLSTGVFVDNFYLDEYLQLIYSNLSAEHIGYCEKHHILPAVYYKHEFGCKTRHQADAMARDDKSNSLVLLSYKDHCKAHWLLYFCTTSYMKHANEAAVRYISGMYKKLSGKEKHKFDFVQEDFDLLQKYMDDVVQDNDSRYWSQEEIAYLLENYSKIGCTRCAKHLNKNKDAVRDKAKQLNLTKRPKCYSVWTEDELAILKHYYPLEGNKVIQRLPGRTQYAIREKAALYNLYTSKGKAAAGKAIQKWTAAEDKILRQYYEKNKELAFKLLSARRSKRSCYAHARKLGLDGNGQVFSAEEISILETYYPIEGIACYSRLPNRTASSLENKIHLLKLYKRDHVDSVPWSQEDCQLLVDFCADNKDLPYDAFIHKLAAIFKTRSIKCIRKKALKLDCWPANMRKTFDWTEEEQKILVWNQNKPTSVLLELLPGRTAASIR